MGKTSSLRRNLVRAAVMVLALVPGRAWATTQNYCTFPSSLSTFSYNGNAFEADETVIRLTTATVNEASSAFQMTPIALTATTSFHAYFRFQMGPSAAGGDGMAFVLHNDPRGAAALGGTAVAMGYGGNGVLITPSAIIEFDTFKNGTNDPNANHVGLMLNGSDTAHTITANPSFTMAGGGVLNAWVDYDGTAKSISVYLSQGTTKPATALFSHALNLFTQVGSQMYVGFTSSTGGGAQINEHDVLELEISTDGVPCTCEGDSACAGATPACGASGICTVCSATNHMACTGAKPVCDVPVSTCVGCLTNADCAAPTPICDKTALACRACAGPADCGGSTPACATTGPNAGSCVVCAANTDCPPKTPLCTTTNTCVQCLGAGNCGGDTPVCKAGSCEACASDADCGGGTPACEVWGACGQCSSTNGTACTGATSVCDYPSGTCVGCEFNSDCSGNKPTCDTVSHTCRACMVDADCVGNPGGPACVTSGMKAGSCVICQVDADCTSTAAPKCDVTANLCVACLSSADCSGATPVCDTGSNICVACLSNADCSGATPVCDAPSSTCKPCENDYAAMNPGPLSCPSAALPACQPAGSPLAGQCATCSSLNDSQCVTKPATPVCIPASATCGCAKDTDCAAGNYCDTSMTSTGVCTMGCRVTGGVDNCATGDYCSKMDGTVGTCLTQPCNSNADCHAPTGVCDTIDQPHGCVQCLNDPDCSGGQVCDGMHHCVECTSNQTQNCSAGGKGAACLAGETCGCATDADCGGATSGRICDPTSHTCAAGCRGTGGNGCPPPQTCSSSDGTAGTCQSASASSSSSSGGGGAGGADGGAMDGGGGSASVVSQSIGCGCRVASGEDDPGVPALAGLVAGLAAIAGRRRRARA